MATIMAIGAHPDDIEIGMGGVIQQLVRRQHQVVAVDLTDGELTPHGTRETRARETDAASEILGVSDRRCLGLPNRVLMDTEEARRRLATVMRATRPDAVFTHIELDAHPDHVAAAQITRGAVLLSRVVKIDLDHEPWRPGAVYHYLCSHLRHPYQPSFIVRLSEREFDRKLEAICKYESQFLVNKNNIDVTDWLSSRMRYFGQLSRGEYGEGFVCDEPVALRSLDPLLEVEPRRHDDTTMLVQTFGQSDAREVLDGLSEKVTDEDLRRVTGDFGRHIADMMHSNVPVIREMGRDLQMLLRVLMDDIHDIADGERRIALAALVYFFERDDVLPDDLPRGRGYLDDAYVAAEATRRLAGLLSRLGFDDDPPASRE